MFFNGIDDLVKIKSTSRGLKYSASSFVPVMNHLHIKLNRIHGIKPTVTRFDSEDLRDSIFLRQPDNQLPDDSVKAGAEASASNNGGSDVLGVVEYLFTGSSTRVG